ncbi:MAG TPA: GNAT family protein [Anaerolineales bacterium]|nr:GNAT family protein [Anaerolineales bacterium]
MTGLEAAFKRLDLRQATENDYRRLSEFKNALNREYAPDDPPIPLEEHIQDWKNMLGSVNYEAYAKWDPSNSEIVAYCEVSVPNSGDNEHHADFMIEVLPEYRNQGIGRQALKLILPFVKNHQRTLLTSYTSDQIPAAEILLEHLGARRGLVMGINQLKISEFNKTLLQQWLSQSENKRSEFELNFLDGAYPDNVIDKIAALRQEVGNDQPRGELDRGDMKITPDLLRQMEHNLFTTGHRRWTLYLMDRADGWAIGLTEVFWNQNRPMIMHQGFTGIYRVYRNQGLGRWLKAEMMNRILADHPEVQFIRTGNVSSNLPMMKINIEMGFKPYAARTIWQVEIEKVEKYLAEEIT